MLDVACSPVERLFIANCASMPKAWTPIFRRAWSGLVMPAPNSASRSRREWKPFTPCPHCGAAFRRTVCQSYALTRPFPPSSEKLAAMDCSPAASAMDTSLMLRRGHRVTSRLRAMCGAPKSQDLREMFR